MASGGATAGSDLVLDGQLGPEVRPPCVDPRSSSGCCSPREGAPAFLSGWKSGASVEVATCANGRLFLRKGSGNQKTAGVRAEFVSIKGFTPAGVP